MSIVKISPFLARLLEDSDEPEQAALVCNSASLGEFQHKDWYQCLPYGTNQLWPTFSVEARALALNLAERLALQLGQDVAGPDS